MTATETRVQESPLRTVRFGRGVLLGLTAPRVTALAAASWWSWPRCSAVARSPSCGPPRCGPGRSMVHDPHAHTLTAIAAVTHPAFILLDPADQERRGRRLGPGLRHPGPVRADRPRADPARLGARHRPALAIDGPPRAGEPGPGALRSWRRFRVPPPAATSAVLAGAYPFLAEGGLGAQGLLVGTDLYSGGAFVFDPWVFYQRGILTNPNVLLAGVIGTGKSCLAKALATRSIAFGAKVYEPGDPKGEWTAVADAVGGFSIQLDHGLPARLNPLDEGTRPGGVSDHEWDGLVAARRRELLGVLAETVLGRALRPVEHTVLDLALRAAVEGSAVPTMPGVVAHLLDPVDRGKELDVQPGDGREVAHALRRLVHGDLEGLFDGESTVRFDPAAPMVTLDLSHIGGNDTLLSLVMTCASAWMEAALLDPAAGRRWVVYDEAWRIMRAVAHPRPRLPRPTPDDPRASSTCSTPPPGCPQGDLAPGYKRPQRRGARRSRHNPTPGPRTKPFAPSARLGRRVMDQSRPPRGLTPRSSAELAEQEAAQARRGAGPDCGRRPDRQRRHLQRSAPQQGTRDDLRTACGHQGLMTGKPCSVE